MTPSTSPTPEILAPAGGREQLTAALLSGADAVYFGASDFNARRNAENFTDEDFYEAVKACRVRGVKAHITLNTLILNGETDRLLRTLRLVAESGADAVIVQDLAVAALVKRHVPTLPLHASTQMAVHNLAGVKLLRDMGFARVVLARELSLKEIAAITKDAGVETEVFVHGAHCMSASGLCYLSAMLGGRSGNRGLCAQPCRLDFKNGQRGHALSLKDLSLLDHLGDLAEAGVSSFKIEGRMKRPEYVAAAVTACKQALAGEHYDAESLRAVFSRSGFTDGYYAGKVNGDMFGYRKKEDVEAAAGVLAGLRALYKDEPKRVSLGMRLTAAEGEPTALFVSDGEREVTVTGPAPERALNAPTSPEKAAAALAKLGGTPYACASPEVSVGEGLLLPASALNALRREAVEKLSALRAEKHHAYVEGEPLSLTPGPAPAGAPAMRLRFQTETQVFDHPKAEKLILNADKLLAAADRFKDLLPKFAAELPVLIYPGDEEKTRQTLASLKALGVREILCENVGAVRLTLEAGLTPLGGMHLNLTNALAVRETERLGVTDNTLSFECPFLQFDACRGDGKLGFVGWGHLPLMRLRACPNRGKTGCGACKGEGVTVKDRRGDDFPLLCEGRRFSTLLNPVPLCVTGLKLPRADFMTLYFTVEPRKDALAVFEAVLRGEKPVPAVTAGLYNKTLQ
ncbi:MAG: U32 family peptidase [Clostridia bacterium]|nr:U32 family peptidase [Clostridia bacterium]